MEDKTKLGVVDLKTGEVCDGVLVVVGRKEPSIFGQNQMAQNQHFLYQLAKREDLNFEILRIFVFLNSRLEFNNLIQLSHTEIAQELGMRRPNVSRTMKRLEELGVILRGPKVGRSCSYRLNPNAGWKGKVTEHRAALKERLRVVE